MLDNLAHHHRDNTMALADNLAALLEPALPTDYNGRNYRYAGGGDVSANFPFRRCDEWDGINAGVLLHASVGRLQVVEDAVFLFLHPNKRGALGQFFQA